MQARDASMGLQNCSQCRLRDRQPLSRTALRSSPFHRHRYLEYPGKSLLCNTSKANDDLIYIMASQEDTDDLYADLYGGDGAGTGDVVDLGDDQKAHDGDEQDLIGYDEDDHKTTPHNGDSEEKKDDQPATAPSTGSFIPPPSSAPQQQPDTGLQIKGSFIPPPTNNQSAHSQSDVRDLTPASHNDVSSGHQDASHGANEGSSSDNREGAQRSEDRSVMPHEMPEEG